MTDLCLRFLNSHWDIYDIYLGKLAFFYYWHEIQYVSFLQFCTKNNRNTKNVEIERLNALVNETSFCLSSLFVWACVIVVGTYEAFCNLPFCHALPVVHVLCVLVTTLFIFKYTCISKLCICCIFSDIFWLRLFSFFNL